MWFHSYMLNYRISLHLIRVENAATSLPSWGDWDQHGTANLSMLVYNEGHLSNGLIVFPHH